MSFFIESFMSDNKLLSFIGISFSLACLVFVRAFRYLLYPSVNGYYEYAIPKLEFVSLSVCILIVTAVFVLMLIGLEFIKHPVLKTLLQILFLIAGLACFTGMNSEILNWLIEGRPQAVNYELPLAIFGIALLAAIKRKFSLENLVRAFQSIALVFVFYGLFLVVQSVYVVAGFGGYNYSPQILEKPSIKSSINTRVVWLIFDELEYATLINRPKQFPMPAFDRLSAESFVADKAYPPNFWTQQSLPSLLFGRITLTTEPTSPRELNLTFLNGDPPKSLSDNQNIFARVKALGGATGVEGWLHPYPRLFQESLDRGYWVGSQVVRCDAVLNCMPELFADAFESFPMPNPFRANKRTDEGGRLNKDRFMEGQIKRAPSILERAVELTADERLNFVFIHFSIPHARFVDRKLNPSDEGYFDSLQAVDESLKEVRGAMEVKGLWDTTTVIVSGDHWWRFKTNEYLSYLPEKTRSEVMEDQRVPFIVKLAEHSDKFVYPTQFNTVATSDIVVGLLSGNLKTGRDLASRIDELRTERPIEMNHIPKREQIAEDVFERNSGGITADPAWTPRDEGP